MSKKLKFKCTECGCETIEEVMVNVASYSPIDYITEGGDMSYEPKIRHEGGEIEHYQCWGCGSIIANGMVDDPEELIEWLKKNCKQDD